MEKRRNKYLNRFNQNQGKNTSNKSLVPPKRAMSKPCRKISTKTMNMRHCVAGDAKHCDSEKSPTAMLHAPPVRAGSHQLGQDSIH